MKVEPKRYSMDDILVMSINTEILEEIQVSKLKINFKKVVNTAQYETETFESEVEVDVPKGLKGIEMEMIHAIIESQLEYGILVKLFKRGSLTDTEWGQKRERIEDYVTSIFAKAYTLGIKDVKFIA